MKLSFIGILLFALVVIGGSAAWFMFDQVIPSPYYVSSKQPAAVSVAEPEEDEEIAIASIPQVAAVGMVPFPPEPEASENVVKVAAILLQFEEDDTDLISSTKVREGLYSSSQSARAYYNEISEGKIYLEGHLDREDGDVFGPYVIERGTRRLCDFGFWANDGEQAASVDGFLHDNYEHVLYFLPSSLIEDCGLSQANAAAPGYRSNYWPLASMSSSQLAGYIIHELGHNFGLMHANALLCRDDNNRPVAVTRTGVCTSSEYGDRFDIMGLGAGGTIKPYLNAHSRTVIGALDSSAIQTVDTSGIYSLGPAELASTSFPRGIKIQLPTPLANGAHSYLLEYRRPIGFDSGLHPDTLDGILIRAVGNRPYTQLSETWLLDASPSTTEMNDKVLRPNALFVDREDRILIRTISVSPTEARVEIKFNEDAPNLAPLVQITSPTGGSFRSNDTVTIRATASDPDGTISFVELYNGSTRLIKDSVPPYEMTWTNPPIGINNLLAKARDNNGLVTTSLPVTVKILPTPNTPVVNDVTPPTVYLISTDTDPNYVAGEVVSLYATASDDVGIERVDFLQNSRRLGSDTTGPSYTYAWNTTGMTPGAYTLTAVAYDRSGKKRTHSIQITITAAP